MGKLSQKIGLFLFSAKCKTNPTNEMFADEHNFVKMFMPELSKGETFTASPNHVGRTKAPLMLIKTRDLCC